MENDSAILIGTLDDDPTSLAGKVKQALGDGHRTVWADDAGRVFLDDPLRTDLIDPAWMVGTFSWTQPLRDIEGDLRALQSERSTDSMVDRPPVFVPGPAHLETDAAAGTPELVA